MVEFIVFFVFTALLMAMFVCLYVLLREYINDHNKYQGETVYSLEERYNWLPVTVKRIFLVSDFVDYDTYMLLRSFKKMKLNRWRRKSRILIMLAFISTLFAGASWGIVSMLFNVDAFSTYPTVTALFFILFTFFIAEMRIRMSVNKSRFNERYRAEKYGINAFANECLLNNFYKDDIEAKKEMLEKVMANCENKKPKVAHLFQVMARMDNKGSWLIKN